MALTLPGELTWVLDLLGYEWPDLDEDEIQRAAHIVRQFREDLEGSIALASSRIEDDVAGAMTANAAGSLTTGWTENREQNMQQLVELLDPAATGIDLFADAVLAMKLKVIAELVITAAQIAAAAASAFFTGGLSLLGNAALLAVRKKALDVLTDLAVEQIAGQVLSMVVQPLTEVAQTVVMAMLEAPVVAGAVGEVSEFGADLEALDRAADDVESNGADQERLGEEFVAQIMSLNISTGV